jgi:hypothetical protein
MSKKVKAQPTLSDLLETSIHLKAKDVEALLIAVGTGNRAAVAAVSQQIREAAEAQLPEVFK